MFLDREKGVEGVKIFGIFNGGLLMVAIFFIVLNLNNPVEADSFEVVINEVAWMGNSNSSSDEWIELKNLSDEDIDLNGWKLESEDEGIEIELEGEIEAGGFFLLERTNNDSVEDQEADLIYTGSLSNSGETLILEDDEGKVVDEVKAEDGWPAGDNDTKQTMEKDEEEDWQNSKEPEGTPGEENSDGPEKEEKKCSLENQPELADIIINEIFPNPLENESDNEWIELFNPSDVDLDLEGCFLADKNLYAKNDLDEYFYLGEKTIQAGGFLVISRTDFDFGMNNGGEEVYFLDGSGEVLDKVFYEDSEEGFSYSFKSGDEWVWTKPTTPGEKNYFPEPEKYSEKIEITEFLPNPDGKDEDKEWIEILNSDQEKINLEGWYFLNQSDKKFKLNNLEIKSKERLQVEIKNTSFTVKNSGGWLAIFNPNDEQVNKIEYSESAKKDSSYNKKSEEEWEWSIFTTPGEKNRFNNKPTYKVDIPDDVYKDVKVEMEIEKVEDEDGEDLKYRWDFGDGHRSYLQETTHTFEDDERYTIQTRVSDLSADVFKYFNIEVEDFPEYDLKIIKLLPNPDGSDSENEKIWIANEERKSVNLEGWSITTGTSMSKLTNHYFKENFKIKGGDIRSVDRDDCPFSLPNKKGRVLLKSPDGEEVDKVKYEKENLSTGEGGIEEDELYLLDGDQWIWKSPVKKNSEKPKVLGRKVPDSGKKKTIWNHINILDNPELNRTNSWKSLYFENWLTAQFQKGYFLQLIFPKNLFEKIKKQPGLIF